MKLTVAFLVTLIPLAVTSPLAELVVRPALTCHQSETLPAGPYRLSLDQLVTASKPKVCAQVDSQSGINVGWSTVWAWEGGNNIKSYTNVAVKNNLPIQLSAIHSIQSSWSWSQSSPASHNPSSVVDTITYRLITSLVPHDGTNEIRIWLATHNAFPVSKAINVAGKPVPVTTNISLAGYTWDLYIGLANGINVRTFVPSRGTISIFNSDLNVFLTYLVKKQGLTNTQYLTAVKAGTEATSGSATFKTSSYSAVVK